MRLASRFPLALALAIAPSACDDAKPKPPHAATATAVPLPSPSPPPPTADGGTAPDRPSVRIDSPPRLVPRAQRLKLQRVGNQVVIDTEGQWQRECAIHHECRVVERALPTCATNRDAESWETVAVRAEHFTDPHVAVKGRLVPDASVFSTGARCEPGVCCNRRRAAFWLEGPPTDLELDHPACVGDESRLCCSILAEGQEVIATGDLQYQSGVWRMARVSLCRVAE